MKVLYKYPVKLFHQVLFRFKEDCNFVSFWNYSGPAIICTCSKLCIWQMELVTIFSCFSQQSQMYKMDSYFMLNPTQLIHIFWKMQQLRIMYFPLNPLWLNFDWLSHREIKTHLSHAGSNFIIFKAPYPSPYIFVHAYHWISSKYM